MSEIFFEIDIMNVVHSFQYNSSNSNISLDEIDLSQFDFINTIWIVRPLLEVVLKTLFFLPIIIGGIIGNITLLTIVITYKRLQSATNILIATMAAVDLITLIFCPWMMMINYYYQNYILGAVGCKMEGFFSASLLIIDVMLLSVVSYHRLIAIILPRENGLSKIGAVRLAILCVIIGIAFASPLFVFRYYKERQWKNFLETYCKENTEVLPIYWHILLTTLVWFPTTFMTICYTTIFLKLDRYQKKILRREHPIAVNYKTRVARTLFIILLTFIACRLPFTVLVFWRNQMVNNATYNSITTSFETLWFISHYLIYLNCALNPIIYGLTNENYKRVFSSTPFYKWISGSKNTKAASKNTKDPNNEIQTMNNDTKSKCCFNYFCCCFKNHDNIDINVCVSPEINQGQLEIPESAETVK